MKTGHTAADLFAVSQGELCLRRPVRVATQPLPTRRLKLAIAVRPSTLPAPRRRQLGAADILAIARHAQPWHALYPARQPLHEAG